MMKSWYYCNTLI